MRQDPKPPRRRRGRGALIVVAVVATQLFAVTLLVLGLSGQLPWLDPSDPTRDAEDMAGDSADDSTGDSSDAGSEDDGPDDEDLPDTSDVDEVAALTVALGAELDEWWTDAASQRRARFQPVEDRITNGETELLCDGLELELDDAFGENAFAAPCTEGMTVGYHPDLFADELTRQVVMAHEWGHIFQYSNPRLDLLVVRRDDAFAEGELQADCFAGAWAADNLAEDVHSGATRLLGRLGYWWDVDDDDPNGHGTPIERRDAFTVGLDGGVDACLPDVFDPR